MKIKVCGITEIETLNFLIDNEVDYAGFIFYENSPRNISQEFMSAIKDIDFQRTRPVCVFVNPEDSLVISSLRLFEDPIIQFHGEESNDFCKSFGRDFWKALRIKDTKSINYINYFKDADAILCDTYQKEIFGGTGTSFDWMMLDYDLLHKKKIILSGGLSIENLEDALSINPWCLDFNSGVESAPGFKDCSEIAKILSTIKNER